MFDKLKHIAMLIPFFMFSVILISDSELESHLHEKCYDMFISLVTLVILLCFVKHGKLSKSLALMLASLLFVVLYCVKFKITENLVY